MLTIALAAVPLIAVVNVRATASDPTAQGGEAANRMYAEGRGIDETANPAFQRAYQSHDDGQWIDPFRRDWSGTRGVMREVHFANRYGAKLRGLMLRPNLPWHDPVTGRDTHGPLPAVVVVVGLDGAAEDYLSETQQLAESGYVVLTVEAQGDHLSESDPSPKDVYCAPDGDWRRPQEGGLTEDGPCAGQDNGSVANDPISQLESIARAHTDPAGFRDAVAKQYEIVRARYTFAAIDAAKWMVSAADDWSSLIDAKRIGVAGHSAGADGAVVAGNADFRHRFKAAIAWDTYGLPPDGVRPTVPTMWQQSEQENLLGPWLPRPDPELWMSYRAKQRWTAAGQPTYLLALRGSTHEEWAWGPDPTHMVAHQPPIAPIYNASAKGEQVADYFTVAWLDRWLKGQTDPVQAADADRRLTAPSFDASADRTNIGTGTYDPVTDSNVPYALAGEPVVNHLSRLFHTRYDFDGHSCADLLAGC